MSGELFDLEGRSRAIAERCMASPSGDLPVSVRDQAEAASRESESNLHDLAERLQAEHPDRNFQTDHPEVPEGEQTALVDGIVLACMTRPGILACPHLRAQVVMPYTVSLANGVAACARCYARRPVLPVAAGDQCEWCRKTGVEIFTPIAFRSNWIEVAGEACDDCAKFVLGALGKEQRYETD